MLRSKIGNIFGVMLLFLNLFVALPAIAETYTPQDSGSIYDDLTGDYGILGIASQFHIFAKEKTTINAHTNGNVATKELDANNNFGTDIITGDLQLEINYVQATDSLIGSSFTSGDSNRVNKFVVGSSISTGIENDRAVVNGSRIDHLSASELYQDRPGNTYIDFDTEFAKLEGASESLMSITPAKTYLSSDFPDMNNRTIDVTGMGSSDVVIINVDASVLSMNTPLNIVNSENKILVMNVINAPTDFTIQSQIHYNNRANHETEDFSDANISWNFPSNVTNLAINAPFQGTIIAPRADVTANQNMDGTIIGKNVTLNAATNRWDPNEIFLADNPDNSGSSDRSTDTTSSDSSTDTTSSDSSTDTTSSDSSTDTTSSDSSTDTTSSDSSTDTTSSDSSTDTTSSDSSTDTTSSDSSTDTTSSDSSTDTTSSDSSTDTTSSDSSTDTTSSDSSTDTTSSDSSTDTTSSDSSTNPTSGDSDTDTTSSDSSTDTTSSDSSTDTTSSDSSSNPTNGNSDTDTPTPFHIDPSMSGEDTNQVYPNNNDKTNQSNGMNSTIPQQGKGTDLDRNEFNSSTNETTNVTDESRSMDFQDQDSQVLPKTNSASNKWLAIVGGMIIVLVVIVGFMRRKKHK
ncbi:collagen-binding domain-containing protein [Enterococcus hirae]|uniref:collagen-binding domain-containing protein n=1 Tax=Enterococcus hirae TaxID=1354 RepID=UPI0013618190|nr:collagen-binding domain-containing protein [Enterococcus hirae]NAA12310.1 choice-of-anchor A family protein [Enterococcus hirae]NAA17422.1 choice-of-anchor A family protein [Enterococcus hirae]NAA47547.1 choice-of-anchor A family protein [Enterococcus hirae]NAA55060.1 choice-of-anchor A family protein [Enterococcus hirae]NAA99032.1 choice-of-anchor A family protein [Enterococcus hirae]